MEPKIFTACIKLSNKPAKVAKNTATIPQKA